MLFRTHLKNVFVNLEEEPPDYLENPIIRSRKDYIVEPIGYLDIIIDGKNTHYFEWIGAGKYISEKDKGVMDTSEEGILGDLHFGMCKSGLCIRIDLIEDFRSHLGDETSLLIDFAEPRKRKIRIKNLSENVSRFEVIDGEFVESFSTIAVDDLIELSCPLENLDLSVGEEVFFSVELRVGDTVVERIPRNSQIHFVVPSKEYESMIWQ